MEPLWMCDIAAALGHRWEGKEKITVVITDSREIVPGCIFVALQGERFDGHDFARQAVENGAVAAVVSRDCGAGPFLQVKDTKDALITIGGLYRAQFALKCVGVTGSVGKTTTKEMIAAVVSAAYETVWTQGNLNNEIGMPKTLFRLSPATQVAVIEMGMQGLGEIAKLAAAAKPDIGVITNIGVSHMEQLGSRENILKAKLELAQALPDGAPLFLCGDNDLLSGVCIPRLAVHFYGMDPEHCDTWAEQVVDDGKNQQFILCHQDERLPVRLPCAGVHNLQNALAACCVGRALGIPMATCVQALAGYVPTGMRQRVVEWKGMTIVEDCYNASPDSMHAALQTLGSYPGKGKRIAVVADMLELGKISKQAHFDVGLFASQNGVDILMGYGDETKKTVEGAKQGGILARHFADKDALLQGLLSEAEPGCVIWVKGSHGMQLETLLQAFYAVS